ncbi:MAG: hypothetical protein ABIP80_01440 [Ferruginibacter sp.]
MNFKLIALSACMLPLLKTNAQNNNDKLKINVDSAMKSEGAKADVYVMDKKIIYDPALIKEERIVKVEKPVIQRKKNHKKKAVKKLK